MRCTLKVAIVAATKEEGDLEVLAKDLDVLPQVFRLRAEEDIVGNCPEKEKINVEQLLRLFCISGNSGVTIFRATVTHRLVPLCQVLRGDVYWPKGTGN